MRVGMLINDFASLKASQTTAMLIDGFAKVSEQTYVFDVGALRAEQSAGVCALARIADKASLDVHTQTAYLKQGPGHDGQHTHEDDLSLASLDLVVIRTNPARGKRDGAHTAALELLAGAAHAGLRVINDPIGLMRCRSKLCLSQLPKETIPVTLIAQDAGPIIDFVSAAPGPCVLKPASGTRGQDVFKVDASSENLNAIVSAVLSQGYVIAQHFVPEAVNGDTRVVVLDGNALAIDGSYAAIRRIPSGRDFRSNIHVGGRAAPGIVTPGMLRVIDLTRPLLKALGLRLVGLDFIGELLCEINVFATGGLRDAEKFTNAPFTQHIVDSFMSE